MIVETNLFPTPVPQSDGYGFQAGYGTGTPSSGSYRIVKDGTANNPNVSMSNPAQGILAKPTTVAVRVKEVGGKGCRVRITGDYWTPAGSYSTWSPQQYDWDLAAGEERTIIASFSHKDAALHFRPMIVVLPPTTDTHNAIGGNASNFEASANPHYWGGTLGATVAISSDRAHLGANSLKVTTVAGQRAKVAYTAALTGENIPGDFCAFTFSAKVSAATAINGKYDIMATWYDADWNWLGDSYEIVTADALAGLGSSWRHIQHSFVVQPQARYVDISIQAQANLTAAETWYLDSVRLEQGEYARPPLIARSPLAAGEGVDILEVGVVQDAPLLTSGIPVVGKPGCRWSGTAHRSNTVRTTTLPLMKRGDKAQPTHASVKGATKGEVLLRGVGPRALPPNFPEPPHPFDNDSSPWRMKASTWNLHPNSANIITFIATKMDSGNNAFVSTHGEDVESQRKWSGLTVQASESDPIVTLSHDPRYSHDWLHSKFKTTGLHLPADALPHPNSDSAITVIQPDGSAVWLWQFFRATMTCSSAYWIYPDTLGVAANQPGGDPRNIGYKHPHCQRISKYDMAKGVIDRSIIGFIPAAAHSATRAEFPAAVRDGSSTDPNCMVVGWRLCIKPSVDLDALNLHPSAMVVAKMLQDYGTTLTDTNSPRSGLNVSIEAELIPGYDNPPYFVPGSLFAALPISPAIWEVRYHPQANP